MTDTPLLRVVRGEPSAEELAALVTTVALLSRPAAGPPTPPARRTPRDLALPVDVGTGRWVASGRTPGTRTRADW